jgi:hypothetical protein
MHFKLGRFELKVTRDERLLSIWRFMWQRVRFPQADNHWYKNSGYEAK